MSDHPFPLPRDLPEPVDDGAAAHLTGRSLPNLALTATDGTLTRLTELGERWAIFIYPMTGRPGTPLPDGWDQIPGARGCTPQACSFRDDFADFNALRVHVYGLSAQSEDDQREAHDRLHLPFSLLSDSGLQLKRHLALPTFVAGARELYKRTTLLGENALIQKVFHPVFPPDQSAQQALGWLRSRYIGDAH